MVQKRNYTKDSNGTTLIRRFRSTNEIPINSETLGGMHSSCDKDALTFPLAKHSSIVASLKGLYTMTPIEEQRLRKALSE